MKRIPFALCLALAALPAAAQSLNDKALLSTDVGFQQRVRASVIAAAVSISNEGSGVALHTGRDDIAVSALAAPDSWKVLFAASVATDATVAGQATQSGTVVLTTGNLATQAALVTDAAINNAVSAQWNSFFQH